jgi:hypothetical protein
MANVMVVRREESAPLIQRVQGTGVSGGTTLHGERWSNKVSLHSQYASQNSESSEKVAKESISP